MISHNEGKHHNKCHLAFWSSSRCGRTDESPTSAFNRALLSSSPQLAVTQSRTLNRTLGFHADTEATSHGWKSKRRKNSQSWHQGRRYVTLEQHFNLMWTMSTSEPAHRIHLTIQKTFSGQYRAIVAIQNPDVTIHCKMYKVQSCIPAAKLG